MTHVQYIYIYPFMGDFPIKKTYIMDHFIILWMTFAWTYTVDIGLKRRMATKFANLPDGLVTPPKTSKNKRATFSIVTCCLPIFFIFLVFFFFFHPVFLKCDFKISNISRSWRCMFFIACRFADASNQTRKGVNIVQKQADSKINHCLKSPKYRSPILVTFLKNPAQNQFQLRFKLV